MIIGMQPSYIHFLLAVCFGQNLEIVHVMLLDLSLKISRNTAKFCSIIIAIARFEA